MPLIIDPGIVISGAVTIQSEIAVGEQLYDTPGTYSWTAPAGVYSVSVVCIGGGGAGARGVSPSVDQFRRGGGGGGLGWKNNIPVVPGQTYTVVVGAGGTTEVDPLYSEDGEASYFQSQSLVAGLGGQGGGLISSNSRGAGGGYVGDGGGTGGQGSKAPKNPLSLNPSYLYVYAVGGGSGGSTAGYTGNGGDAGTDGDTFAINNPREIFTPSAGTGGGAGGSWNATPNNFTMTPPNSTILNYSFGAGSGGSGTGPYGQGTSGGFWKSSTQEYITSGPATAYGADAGAVGQPGSGGGPAIANQGVPGFGNGYGAKGLYSSNTLQIGGNGGLYGGGGGAVGPDMLLDPNSDRIGYGGDGAVRIIWGTGRSFPNNAGLTTYRSLLSTAGKTAYDAAAANEWFEVSAADYNNVQTGILDMSTVGVSNAQLTQAPDGTLAANNWYTLPAVDASIAGGNYVLGLAVRPSQNDASTWSFRPYIGENFKLGTWSAVGSNSLTVGGTDTKYFLCKNPTSSLPQLRYLAVGPSTPNSGSLNWAAIGGFATGPAGVGSSPPGDPNLNGWTDYTPGLGIVAQWMFSPASYQWT